MSPFSSQLTDSHALYLPAWPLHLISGDRMDCLPNTIKPEEATIPNPFLIDTLRVQIPTGMYPDNVVLQQGNSSLQRSGRKPSM
jgi:hypothetical protein